jgi:hypothetical protein
MPNGIMILDRLTHKVSFINKHMRKYLSFEEESPLFQVSSLDVREQAGCYHRWRAIIDDDNNTDLYSTPKGADLITSQIKTDLSHCENLWDFITYTPSLSSA